MDHSLHNLLDIIGNNSSASEHESDGNEQQKNSSGEEVIEMTNNNTLCASSSAARIESTNVNLPNQEAGKMKMEQTVEQNVQSSNNGESFPMEQPISFQLKALSPLKATTIPPITSPYAEKIYIGANFSSFAEFERAFEEWKQIFHHPFRVASSEKHKDTQLAERFKYRCVVYHCSRYGERRKRGADKRPYQNYLPCGYNAILRLNFYAQNGGSLCVTKLFTEHNHDHAPINEENGGFGTKRIKNSPQNDLGKFSSPNSPVSSIAATNVDDPSFSPLSFRSGLHHSPSSTDGQSSSAEGANNDDVLLGLDGILNGLISPQAHQNIPLHHHKQNSPHYLAKSSTMASSSAQSRKQHNVLTGNTATASSMLTSAALKNQLQQIISTSSSSSSATPQIPNSTAMTLVQLQALINFFKQSSKQQQQTPKPSTINPNVQHLLQQSFSGAGHQQAQQRNLQLAAEGGLGLNSRESAKSGGQEIVQEADLLLQMLVDQMIRCQDLGAYLRRLRQFLTENYQ